MWTQLTPEKKAEFVKLLRDSANISRSCEAIGISRQCYYNHLKSDPDFKAEVDNALEFAADELEQEARRRALMAEKPSDTLLIFMLKGAKPAKYAERVVHKIDPREIDSLIESELTKLTATNGDNPGQETTIH